MHYRELLKFLSTFFFGLTIPLLLPFGVAIYCEKIALPGLYPQPKAAFAFFLTILISLLLGVVFRFLGRHAKGGLFRKEALLGVVLIYFFTGVIGGLPFLFNGTFKNPLDAFFETVSGLTTTGATVMQAKEYEGSKEVPIERTFDIGKPKTYTFFGTIKPVLDGEGRVLYTGIEAVSPALLLWRSQTQWLGGCGIVVLFLAILPILGVGGKVLYQTEVTGPSKESMTPRIKETASHLWKIYLGLTLIEAFLLLLTNKKMGLLDAVCVSFSTLSTGGFCPKNGSIAAYDSSWTEWIVILFMILGAISFSLYFFIVQGKLRRLNDPELKIFLLIIIGASLFSFWQLYSNQSGNYTLNEAFRHATFQIVSAQTSTGFATANFDVWPFSVQTLMLIVMFVGGMAGSTAGGIKVIRLQMCVRILIDKVVSIFRPDSIRTHRLGLKIIDEKTATTVLCFFLVVAASTIVGTFLLVWDKIDPETALTTMACMVNNIGFGFRMGGPVESFAFLSNFGKLLSSAAMIAGRLEYFALLVILIPAFWRKI